MRQADELGIGFAWNTKREAARDQNNLVMGTFPLELTMERIRTDPLKLGPFAFCNCSSRLKDLCNFAPSIEDLQVDARRLRHAYRQNIDFQRSKTGKYF